MPYSVVDESVRAGKPKFRLTTDLSWPPLQSMRAEGGGWVDSVNGAMDRSGWPPNRLLRVGEFAEAMAMFQGAQRQRRARMWSIDCEAFYRAVGRQRSELWRNGILLPDGVMLDERCCFGDASAAVKCARISNLIVYRMRAVIAAFDAEFPTRDEEWVRWQAERREAALACGVSEASAEAWASLSWLGMYIDDVAAGGADDALFDAAGVPVMREGEHVHRQTRHFELARDVLAELGWTSAPSKEQPPSECVDTLGVTVDMCASRMRLSDAKRARYSAQARQVAALSVASEPEFREMVGRLQFATLCYPLGQQAMHAPWRALRGRYRLQHGGVCVGSSVRRDLLWWAAALEAEDHEGVPLACCGGPQPGGVLYADASLSDEGGGFSAWTVVEGEVWMVAGEWTEAERSMLICDLELLASTFGLVAFGAELGSRWVWSFTDNTVAEAAMRHGRARSPQMQAMLARRGVWMHERGLLEVSRRISSQANVWADVGSRAELGGLAAVRDMAAAMGLGFRELHVPPEWRDTAGLLLAEPMWC